MLQVTQQRYVTVLHVRQSKCSSYIHCKYNLIIAATFPYKSTHLEGQIETAAVFHVINSQAAILSCCRHVITIPASLVRFFAGSDSPRICVDRLSISREAFYRGEAGHSSLRCTAAFVIFFHCSLLLAFSLHFCYFSVFLRHLSSCIRPSYCCIFIFYLMQL